MSTKILSTLIFSTLLFASMYSEANNSNKPILGGTAVKPGTGGSKRVEPSGSAVKVGDVNASVRLSRQALPRRNRAVQNGQYGVVAPASASYGKSFQRGSNLLNITAARVLNQIEDPIVDGRVAIDVDPMSPDIGVMREGKPVNKDMDRTIGTAAFRKGPPIVKDVGLARKGRNGDLLREGEVVRDIDVMRTDIDAGTNQSHRLNDGFKEFFSKETAEVLSDIVNGVNAHLKVSVLNLQKTVVKGTHQFTVQTRENVTWAGKLIVFVSGLSAKKSQANQDPLTEELLHDMANNVSDAVTWSKNPRNNFFNIVQGVLRNGGTHKGGLAGAFKDAVRETFELAKEKVMKKFWDIRRECRV